MVSFPLSLVSFGRLVTDGVHLGLRYTGVWNSAALQTADIQAALLSGLNKRTPTFEKL